MTASSLTTTSESKVKQVSQRTAHMLSLLTNGIIFIQEYLDHVDDMRHALFMNPLTPEQREAMIFEYETAKAGRR